jgi:hypothetical protein
MNYMRMETIHETTEPKKSFKLKLFLAIPLVLLISFLSFNSYQSQFANKVENHTISNSKSRLLATINNFKHKYRHYLIHKKATEILNDRYNSSCISKLLISALHIDYENSIGVINYEKIKQKLSYNYSFYDSMTTNISNTTKNANTHIINMKNNSHYPYNMICGVESYYLTSKYLMTNDSYSYNLYEPNGSVYIRLFSFDNYSSEPMKQYISDYIDNNYLDVYNYDGNNHYTINYLYIYDKDEYISKVIPIVKPFKILLNNIK